MVEHIERIAKLQSLGLTENQAKAYLALLDLGQSSASALNKISGVPRNKVYSVVEELNGKGLVDIVLEDPIVFEARPIAGYLDGLVARLEDRRNHLETQKDVLADLFPLRRATGGEDLEVGSFRLFRGRKAVLKQHRRMSHAARHHVRVLCSKNSAARTLASGTLHDYRPEEGERAVALEVFTPLDADNAEAIDRLHEALGDVVRVCTDAHGDVVIKMVDDRQVMFTHFVPDSPSLTTGGDIGVWTDNPVFVALARGMFQAAATGSRSVPTARALVQRAQEPPRFETIQDAERIRGEFLAALCGCVEGAFVMPAEDVRLAMAAITDDHRKRIHAGKRRMRMLSDMPADELAALPWGPAVELRALETLPTCLAIMDLDVWRSYDMDDTGAAFFAGVGSLVIATDLESARIEAQDHFERLWADATPVARVPPTATTAPVTA